MLTEPSTFHVLSAHAGCAVFHFAFMGVDSVGQWFLVHAGNQGHADVATTSLPPLDEGHLKPAPQDAAARPRPGAGLLSRAFEAVAKSAADAAKGAFSWCCAFKLRNTMRSTGTCTGLKHVSKECTCTGLVREIVGGGEEEEHLRLRCALMRLSLPIDLLATQLLRLQPMLDALPS